MKRNSSGFTPIIILLLVVVCIGIGGYLFRNKLTGLIKINLPQKVSVSIFPSPTPTPDPTANWKTYTNNDFHYQMRYPNDWTVEETKLDVWEASGRPVEFVTFFSPGKKYTLTFGIKNKGQDIGITMRTGTAAGDLVDGSPVIINGVTVPSKNLVYQNKIVSVFYPNAGGIYNIGKYDVYADLDYAGQAIISYDLANSVELKTSSQILSTFKFTQ